LLATFLFWKLLQFLKGAGTAARLHFLTNFVRQLLELADLFLLQAEFLLNRLGIDELQRRAHSAAKPAEATSSTSTSTSAAARPFQSLVRLQKLLQGRWIRPGEEIASRNLPLQQTRQVRFRDRQQLWTRVGRDDLCHEHGRSAELSQLQHQPQMLSTHGRD